MFRNINVLKMFGLSLVLLGLFAFSNSRNSRKSISNFDVEFVGQESLYLTQGMVDKLLIQSFGNLKNISKDKLVLNTIEKTIQTNEMVKGVQVYLSVNGELRSNIVQRRPIGRITGDANFYLDDEGKRMPLSNNHSARVPIISGKISDDNLKNVFKILVTINKDDFLRKNVVGVHVVDFNRYQLKLRMNRFVLSLGNCEKLVKKFNNFKAFYVKATKDKTIDDFSKVSLAYNNQVVCTKI